MRFEVDDQMRWRKSRGGQKFSRDLGIKFFPRTWSVYASYLCPFATMHPHKKTEVRKVGNSPASPAPHMPTKRFGKVRRQPHATPFWDLRSEQTDIGQRAVTPERTDIAK